MPANTQRSPPGGQSAVSKDWAEDTPAQWWAKRAARQVEADAKGISWPVSCQTEVDRLLTEVKATGTLLGPTSARALDGERTFPFGGFHARLFQAFEETCAASACNEMAAYHLPIDIDYHLTTQATKRRLIEFRKEMQLNSDLQAAIVRQRAAISAMAARLAE
jgi:hypothetical protein